jgi:hypothetical protein
MECHTLKFLHAVFKRKKLMFISSENYFAQEKWYLLQISRFYRDTCKKEEFRKTASSD